MTNLLLVLVVVLTLGLCWKAAMTYIRVMGKYYHKMYSNIGRE